MAGKLTLNPVQINDSATATNNFVLKADNLGGLKLSRGNDGATSQDILEVDTNGVVSTPVGQIKFPATENPSTDVNTLDDYQEGTWTPVASFLGGDGNLSLNTQVGLYTKIGRVVYCQFYLAFGETTASGALRITGLPFPANSTANANNRVLISVDNMTGLAGGCVGSIVPTASSISCYQNGTGNLLDITAANTGNPSQVAGNFHYFV